MRCPICGRRIARPTEQTDPARRFFPFCSERCRMVDLGHWLAEDYRISRPLREGDLPDSAPPSEEDGSS